MVIFFVNCFEILTIVTIESSATNVDYYLVVSLIFVEISYYRYNKYWSEVICVPITENAHLSPSFNA